MATEIDKTSQNTQYPTVGNLFYGFFCLGISAFGGALPLARRMVVEKHRWLTSNEFVDLLGLCQFLPGGNIINFAVAIGMKFQGIKGAVAALLGLISAPSVIIIMLGMVYHHFQNDPVIQHMFAGLAAAAAGLLISMAIKIAWPLRRQKSVMAIAAICFLAIAVWRFPLLPTMLVLTPVSILSIWWARR